MEVLATYKNSSELKEVNSIANYDIPYELEAFETSALQDTVQAQIDSVPPKPTLAQIRYWRWLREKKMLIDGSRYIQSRNDVKLISSVKYESKGLGLPIREKNSVNSDWITILFIVAIILIASVRGSYSKYIGYLFQSLVNYSTSFRMFREKNYTILHGAFRLEALFYITFSVFLYQVVQYFQLTLAHKNMLFYVTSFGVVIAYFLAKKFIYSILGLILEGASETSEYLFNMDNYNRTLGLVLFPIVALINYYPSETPLFLVFAGIFAVGIFYIFMLQRGIYILLRKQFSIFYLFLYLCTLEFLPLFLIYKIAIE